MKVFLTGFAVALLAAFTIQAKNISFAFEGEKISDKEKGYSFNAPKDWKNQKVDDGYIFTNSAETANIVVKPHSYDDFDSFAAAEFNLETSGFKLSGEVRDLGNGGKMARVYKPNGGKNLIIDAFFLLSPYQGGVLILSLTNDSTTADKAFYAANDVVKSLLFSQPQQDPQDSKYKAAFGGKKLSYFYTGNGFSESQNIWLCPNGTFFSKRESLSSSSIGSGSTYSEDGGIWRIQSSNGTINLILSSNKGNGNRNFKVTARQAGNEIALNGNRYFVETQNQCK